MIMTALDILKRDPHPDDATIRHELEGNLCRCTGYLNIVKAIRAAAEALTMYTAPFRYLRAATLSEAEGMFRDNADAENILPADTRCFQQ